MGREFELKFRAEPAQQAAIRAAFSAHWRRCDMETTYYDTPQGDMSARRWTLRRRMENGRPVCTVKTPAPGGARGEWETECGHIQEAIPVLCKLGCPPELEMLTAGGLREVCGARFTRQAGTLDRENCTLELALDSGVLLGGGRECPLCEVEVELKAGSEEGALAFASHLAAQFGLIPEGKSKYRRALALAEKEGEAHNGEF